MSIKKIQQLEELVAFAVESLNDLHLEKVNLEKRVLEL